MSKNGRNLNLSDFHEKDIGDLVRIYAVMALDIDDPEDREAVKRVTAEWARVTAEWAAEWNRKNPRFASKRKNI